MYKMYRTEDFGITKPEFPYKGIFSKRTKTRETCQFGKDYFYSGRKEIGIAWSYAPDLELIMQILNNKLGLHLNCCLVNKYLDGMVSGIGKHKDDEAEHCHDTIVSVSFGDTVPFHLGNEVIEVYDGDIIVFNRHLWHEIPYAQRRERISLTYRQFK